MPQTARDGRKTSTTGSRSGTKAGSRTRATKARSGSGTAGPTKKNVKKKGPTSKRSAPTRRAATKPRPPAKRNAKARQPSAASTAAAAPRAGIASRNNGSKSDAGRVREALLARRAETMSLLERASEFGKQRLREDAEDLVDQATDSQARDVVHALSSVEGDMIKRIDGALQRLDQGEYGTCVSCGEPIQRRRLEAVPWATLCVACQELQEQGILQAD